MKDIHLTASDFTIQWYSGTGKGGQHRNKHQNCCRIIHNETGLRAQGTESRERSANQRKAFQRLAILIISSMQSDKERRKSSETIRNYHAVRNEVHDKASGLKLTYRDVVEKGDISRMVDARRKSIK